VVNVDFGVQKYKKVTETLGKVTLCKVWIGLVKSIIGKLRLHNVRFG
jgi:hypothetical protein